MSNMHSSSRGGSSLVEMITIMFVTGSVLIVSARLMSRAVTIHQSAVGAVVEVRILERLEQRMRGDVRDCRAATLRNEKLIELDMGDERLVRYEVSKTAPQSLERYVIHGSQATAVDSWKLPFAIALSLQRETTASGAMLTKVRISPVSRENSDMAIEIVGAHP